MSKLPRRALAIGLVCAVAVATAALLRRQQSPTPEAVSAKQSPQIAPRTAASAKPLRRPGIGTPTVPPDTALEFPPGTVEGEVVLTFSDQAKLRAFLRRAQAAGINPLGVLNGLNAVRMRATDLAGLGDPGGTVDFNYLVSAPTMPEPRQPDGSAYAEFGTGAMEWLGSAAAPANWGDGVKIALLDTGVEPNSPVASRLAGTLDVTDGSAVSGDFTGHGTAIATLLLGEENRVEGVAPGADVLSVRVVGDDGVGDSYSLARGIVESVDQGARVLSISLGSFGDSRVVQDAIAYAQARDAVVVAAAGNEGVDTVAYPARYDGVIGVTATDADGQVPYFGNRGPEVDVAAPGVGVVTRWDAENGVSFTGTSAAVPFVSGTIAGLISQEPYKPAAETAQLVVDYSNDGGAPGADPTYGAGILNIDRLTTRNDPGIYSLAIADYYVDEAHATAAGVPVVISAQNRGTEPLFNVLLETTVAGVPGQQMIDRLEVGQTGSYTVMVPAGTEAEITAAARSLVSGTAAPTQTRVVTPATPAR